MQTASKDTTKQLNLYAVSYYNHCAVEQAQLFVKAHNRMEAASIAIMEIGQNATMDDIDSLTEINDDYFITYEEAYNKYIKLYNKDPILPEAKWDDKEQEWYYKEDSDGTRYYY